MPQAPEADGAGIVRRARLRPLDPRRRCARSSAGANDRCASAALVGSASRAVHGRSPVESAGAPTKTTLRHCRAVPVGYASSSGHCACVPATRPPTRRHASYSECGSGRCSEASLAGCPRSRSPLRASASSRLRSELRRAKSTPAKRSTQPSGHETPRCDAAAGRCGRARACARRPRAWATSGNVFVSAAARFDQRARPPASRVSIGRS